METLSTPRCIGFIMDGNRRWAKAHNLPTLEGHRKGGEVLLNTIRYVRDREIPHAVFYAFSTENWKRSEAEVADLMKVFLWGADTIVKSLLSENTAEHTVQFRFIGDVDRFPKDVSDRLRALEQAYPHATTTIWIAVSYGGRAEIVSAVNQAVTTGTSVTEESFPSLLMTAGMPDPDMIVRTGGAERLSNFLPWQSVYSELLFIDTLWPAIDTDALDRIFEEYARRIRNFGV